MLMLTKMSIDINMFIDIAFPSIHILFIIIITITIHLMVMIWLECPMASMVHPVVWLVWLVFQLLVEMRYSWMDMLIETMWVWIGFVNMDVMIRKIVGSVLTLKSKTFTFIIIIIFFVFVIVTFTMVTVMMVVMVMVTMVM